jgi:putative DNA primase/helicase
LGQITLSATGLYSLHDFRHAAVSLWIEQRIAPKRVQTWMGHSSIAVTYDVYGHLFAALEDDAAVIQPDKMVELFRGADDGLVARLLLAWPEPRPFQRPKRCGDSQRLEGIYRRLDSLGWAQDELGNNAAVVLPLTPEAADRFDAWAIENDTDIDDTGSLYKNFCGKMKGVVLRLALITELLQWADRGGDEPREISAQTVLMAADFVDEYAKPMALRVYGDASLPQAERDAAVVAKHILRTGVRKFNARSMRRAAGYPGPKDPEQMAQALKQLVDGHWVQPAPSRDSDKPGRHSLDYIVNSGVFANGQMG